MITKIDIRKFKCFEHLELPHLSRVTLLGGRNNVGKSSLLEAIFMLYDRLNPQMILRQYAWRGVHIVSGSAETIWTPIFYNYNINQDIVISSTVDNKKEKMTLKFNPNYIPHVVQATQVKEGTRPLQIRTDQQPNPSYSLDIRYDSPEKKNQMSHMLFDSEGRLALQVDDMMIKKERVVFIGARMNVPSSVDAERFGQLDIVGKQNEILDFLKIVEPNLKSLSSIAMGDTSLVHGDIGFDRKIPISFMGDGVSRLFSIILAIATSKGGIVIIDECENGIHHSVMPKIWESIGKAAREYDCQVIGTTHSYECLESAYRGFSGDLKNDFTYIRIDKIDDKTIAKTFNYKSLKIAIDSKMEVR